MMANKPRHEGQFTTKDGANPPPGRPQMDKKTRLRYQELARKGQDWCEKVIDGKVQPGNSSLRFQVIKFCTAQGYGTAPPEQVPEEQQTEQKQAVILAYPAPDEKEWKERHGQKEDEGGA